MIITCTCGAKLKISEEKLTDAGVRIKCPKCGTVHLARKSVPAAAVPAAEPAMPWFAPAASVAAPLPAPPAPTEESRAPQRKAPVPASQLLLVAHDSKVVADMIQGVVKDAGLIVEHATDGLDALKKATALKPRVMIVDVGLTGIYGFELCERLKGDPETRNIKIILLSSVYGLTAYKRSPVQLYGADDYIEKHHIPDKLLPKVQQLLSGKPAAAPEPAPAGTTTSAAEEPAKPAAPPQPPAPPIEQKPVPPAPLAAAPQVPAAAIAVPDIPDVMPKTPVTLDTARKRVAAQAPPAPVSPQPKTAVEAPTVTQEAPAAPPKPEIRPPAPQDASIKLDADFFEQEEYVPPAKPSAAIAVDPEEVEKARRFARLVVSDIVLYNQEAVTEGIAKGTFLEILKEDITEGRSLYDKRVPEAIRATKDYYQEAIDNFIAQKKKQR